MQSTKPKKLKIIFFGNERLATGVETTAPTLNALIDNGYEIRAVVVSHAEGQSRKKRGLEVETIAQKNNIPILFPGKVIDIKDRLISIGADIGVLVAFGQIVPQELIDIFPSGIINVHPSLLPKFRGPTPIEQVILDGDSKTGVSVMQLAAKMDAGPVFAQETISLTGSESKQELATQLGVLGSEMVINCLSQIAMQVLVPTSQDDHQATYCQLIAKDDGLVKPSLSPELLERQVRAFLFWPKSYLEQNGQRFIITKALPSSFGASTGKLGVHNKKLYYGCRDGSLEILEIQPAGKPLMNATAFINGYKNIL